MTTEPKIIYRHEQPYVGIRTQAAVSELPTVIPQLFDETAAWLVKQAITPVGAPFIRYHIINMPGKLDIEMAYPVEGSLSGSGSVSFGVLPAGQYASLLYRGPYDGLMEANAVLIGWAEAHGLSWDRWDDENGDAFRSRLEIYHTDPDQEPDPANWETEVAIKLADE
ncbi:MAG: GyrI-like domain-containing protein [Chloroflexi bacterium]|nr:GyrI-like domain-containing protein [Chloroflexota bacterium]